jgi:hypothetical protein
MNSLTALGQDVEITIREGWPTLSPNTAGALPFSRSLREGGAF